MTAQENLVVRAVKTQQGDGIDVYAFFLHGSDLTRIADISRIRRNEKRPVIFLGLGGVQ